MSNHLFVYGTLMRGECRARFLADQEFVGDARTTPAYRLFDAGDYPALIESEPGVSVHGELWRVSAACLTELDEVEGVDEGLYARQTVGLSPPYETLAAETYVYRLSTANFPDIGCNWRDR